MRRLALIPFVLGAIAALAIVLPEQSAAIFSRVVLICVALATAASALLTMRRFTAGDRLYVTWALLGTGYLLAAVRYSLRLISLLDPSVTYPRALTDGMLIVQNILVAASLFLFVRAWRATGLANPGSRGAQIGGIVAGIAVAVIVGGFPLLQGVQTAKADLVLLVSTAGDMVGIALIVPLMMSALALRGGLLMHTWVYLAASESVWLLYDIWYAIRASTSLEPRASRGIEEAIRIVAIGFALIASMAQRRALR
jgi:hypothetical protein